MIISHRNCLSAVKPVRPVRPVTCVTAVLSVTCCLQLVTYPPFEKHSHPWRFNLTAVRYFDRMVNYYLTCLIYKVIYLRLLAEFVSQLELNTCFRCQKSTELRWICMTAPRTCYLLSMFDMFVHPTGWEWRLCTIDDVPTLNIQTHLVLSEEQVQRCISSLQTWK